ncbi:MAG: cytochrome C [Vicinamibacteria bacterium]
MSSSRTHVLLALAVASFGVASQMARASDAPVPAPARASDDVSVSMCDGESVMTIPGLKPGEVLPPLRAKEVAGQMMQVWRRSQPTARWTAWASETPSEPALTSPAGGASATSTQTTPPAQAAAPPQPTKFTARDLQLWQREEKKFIDDGYKNFHNAKALGGTIGISCDMCHPDASNTHPETYPKFQSQTRKVALLRDMINWCIENPMKGKPLAENDPVLRSVEAYLMSARKGVAMEAGKH